MGLACNICGKKIKKANGIIKEDFLEFSKQWGYFSEKDGVTHKICICETCYDQWVKNFKVPIQEDETIEMI